MPIVTYATSSKAARVMNPAVRTTMPVESTPTQNIVARRNRRLRPGTASPVATVARNDSPRPVAMMSCMTGLTGIGTMPTAVRCSPAEMSATRNARADPRRPPRAAPRSGSVGAVGSATRTRTPYAARKNPENITIVLNARPEKSEWVPSCEKWCCHHVGSCVVRTARRTPAGSESTASRPMRWAMSGEVSARRSWARDASTGGGAVSVSSRVA